MQTKKSLNIAYKFILSEGRRWNTEVIGQTAVGDINELEWQILPKFIKLILSQLWMSFIMYEVYIIKHLSKFLTCLCFGFNETTNYSVIFWIDLEIKNYIFTIEKQ